jgi:hypothetical protein
MDDDTNVTPMRERPVSERLGTERLYADEFPADDENMFFGNKPVKPKSVVGPPGRREPAPATLPAPQAGPARLAEAASTVLELAGITALTVGCWLIAPAAGLIVAGLCLLLLGVAMGYR